jgi:hypothetical protein
MKRYRTLTCSKATPCAVVATNQNDPYETVSTRSSFA